MTDHPLLDVRLAVIGAGVMGEAVVAGLVDRRLIAASRVTCSHPRAERCDALAAAHGVAVTPDNAAAARDADIVLLAVKPQMLGGVLAELRGSLRAEQLVVSIIAGASTKAIGGGLQHPAVVRTMPSTPAQIGEGVTVWYATPDVDERGRDRVRAMLGALGREFEVADERQVAMATAVSGTGPTYIFLFIEALTDAAVHLGFPRHVARELVLDTMSGSADFALQSGKHVAELRDMVTSPGGTSAEALYQLEKGRLRTVVSDAVWAAFERTLQLEARLEGRDPETGVRSRR
ncbi:MAG: pyrroline-5-carboxylate reductase [Candidatus Dormibacteria bacterium]